MSTTGEAADVAGSDQPATSNLVAVSPGLEKCNECEADPAVVFCLSCDASLCASCDTEVVHNSRTSSKHPRMETEKYNKVRRDFGGSAPTDEQLDEDSKHMFCLFSPIEYQIQLSPLLASLVIDPNARPSLVAFVGPSGAGKSTILRLLMSLDGRTESDGWPVAGAADDAQSTSADIHMYAGGQVEAISGPQSSTDPVLYVDCEGLHGSKEPRASQYLYGAFENIFQEVKAKSKIFQTKRSEHVQSSYPRMCYIFSDVLCYVFQGSWRERDSILTPLLEWGKAASLGAANQHNPHLILIFNKVDDDDLSATSDDFRKTFTKWTEGDENRSGDDLRRYFSDPLVCLLPHRKIGLQRLLSQVKLLGEEIRRCSMDIRRQRELNNQLFTRGQLQHYMQLAADSFSQDPKGEFDIYKATMARRRPSPGLAGYIVEFRRAVVQANSECTDKYERHRISLSVLQSRFSLSVLLWMRRLDLNLPVGGDLPTELQNALAEAQKSIDGEMPCAAVHPAYGLPYTCDTVRQMHSDNTQHSDTCDTVEQMHSGNTQHCSSLKADRWDGSFTPDPKVQLAADACRLVDLAKGAVPSKLQMKDIRSRLSDRRRDELGMYPWLEGFTFYRVCVFCIIELPTEVLSCGHIICAMCAKEAADMCSSKMIIDLTCPVCLSPAKWYPKDLPQLAGYRILSLDGGGVRGIVELLSLERIMSFFHGMHVEDLFDIIVGTSTGGIIALALTVRKLNEDPKRLQDVTSLFQNLCRQVFSRGMTRTLAANPLVLRICQVLGIYDTKYKNDNLLRLLKEHFGEQSLLLSCVGGPRVIVTSCDRDNGLAAAWFTSYNRPIKENELSDQTHNKMTEQPSLSFGRVPDNHLFSAKDAAAATSAAGTYFPAYAAGGRFWVDGGLRNNCPAKLAVEEARTLWPKRSASALVSLGCGRLLDDEKRECSDNIFQVLKLLVNVVTDAETLQQHCFQYVEDLQSGASKCCLRLNPTIQVPKDVGCALDDVGSVPFLITETKKFLDGGGNAIVQEAANLLFAALFYLHVEIDLNILQPKVDSFRIRSRAALPSYLRNALIDRGHSTSPLFSVTVYMKNEVAPKNKVSVKAEFLWDKCTWDEDVMDLPFSFLDLPMSRRLKVLVKLHMCLPETSVPEGWSLPISGMPWSLDGTD